MIIGLYGDSRSGKDTIAKLMVDHGFEWRSFAAPLREILLNINPLLEATDDDAIFLSEAVRDYGWDGVKKHYPYSVDMMIALGQSVRDLIHEDAWVWGVFTDPLPKNMVISDVRQPNEYEAIIDAGGEVWKVVRAGTTRRGMDGLLDSWEFPVVIHNNGSADDLKTTIDREISYVIQDRGI